ncbi:MAG: GntR family transcriptional regulator [Herminiimonas sp.]|nr:GntR family transcriptional regulator [Herminiimonas sp.]
MTDTVAAPDTPRGGRADAISKKIADDIVLGRFPPGARLDEVMLASLFQVSRTPVREALKQLAIQGLVVCRPNRGAVVAEMTPEQLDRMFEAIGELEAACARHASVRMSAADRERLGNVHAQSRQAMRAGDFDLYDRLNQELHTIIIQGSCNPVLIDMTFSLRHRVSPYRRSQFRNVERMSASFEEHAVIVEALLAHDAVTVYRQMRTHLHSARTAAAMMATSWVAPSA